MPQKCETISYCNPTPYREPRSRASCPPSVWRFDTMHLKPYPKLLEKEKRRESVHDATRVLHADQQGVIRTEWGIRQACGVMSSPGNGTANRCPLSIISPNSLRCRSNSDSTTPTRVSWTRKTKAPSITTFTSSLVLLSSLNGLENGDSLRIYQGEDEDGALDIWAVIKPGNTKEKIALFAAQKCGSTCNDSDGVDGVDNMCEQESISPELRSVSLKNKSCWDGDWSVAKRRRRSGNPDKPKGMDSPAPKPEMQRIFPSEVPSVNVSPCKVTLEDEEAEKTVSVVEMVAYLEQRVNNQLVSTKPPSLRSTSSITLSTQQSKDLEQPEVQEEEGESVRVLDMVAKLESQCLNGQVLREGGDLSRNNSLRRKVGRVLLAGSELYSLPSHSVSPTEKERTVQSETQELDSVLDKLTPSSHELEKTEISQCSLDSTTLHHDDGLCMAEQQASPDVEPTCNVQSLQRHSSSCGNEEPLPGMLFFIQKDQHCPPLPENTPQIKELNIHDSKPSVETLLSLREDNSEAYVAEQNHQNVESETSSVVSRESVPFPLRRLVSHEFLEMRFKIQLLLEPQQYMFFLPHHIIVKMFCLLPTESLAALKCTCQYFKFIIESYGVRPADSRWVSDPRYKDDPCKQCKRRYDRGDVSLCRWHHKPYCQALPYGPGYWMCCRGSQKDTPGCNVGLHDNHWVPAFHSINMPIYKKSRDMEEDS